MASPTEDVEAARLQELLEEVVSVSGVGVEGVFLRRASKKLTLLVIRFEKLRLRLRPKSGLCV